MNKYYKVSEAAELLDISAETLRRWDNSGKFRSTRHPINNYRVYSENQLLSLAKEFNLKEFDLFDTVLYDQNRLLEPIFRTDLGQLYNMDAIEFMRTIPSNSVQLVFADPPYNIKKAEWDTFESQKIYVEWSMEWIREAHRILTQDGSLFICGFSEILADLKWACSSLFKGCKWLVWYYRNKGNLGKDWGRSHESILHLRKGSNFILNMDEVRIPYNAHTTRYPNRTQGASSQFSNGKEKKPEWSPNPLGAKAKDVFEIPTISNGSWEKMAHPTQKPVELMRKIILGSSNQDSLIYDPFGGSGSTYAVAEAYGRQWIGTEFSLEYCNLIARRIQDKEHIERIRSRKDEISSAKLRGKLR